jgi:hypothetical protein
MIDRLVTAKKQVMSQKKNEFLKINEILIV